MIERSIPFTARPVDIVRIPGGSDKLPGARQAGLTHDAAVHQAGTSTSADKRAKSDERLIAMLADIETSLRDLKSQRRSNLDELQHVAVELAVAVASRLVHEQINAGDYAVEKVVGQVIEKIKADNALTVRLHPNDLTLFRNRTKDITPSWQDSREIVFVPDPNLQPGDCRVDAGETGLLSEIASQLSDIRCHLLEALGDAQNERRNAQESDRSLRRFPDRRDTA